MTDKEKYSEFCQKVYVPVFSKPWWMDAICGEENWGVWLYGMDESQICAAMPYYMETRNGYDYITKAILTQINGLFIDYPAGQKLAAKQVFEEKICNAAIDFIESKGLGVYEQQYHHTFSNFLPFWWRGYSIIPRFTYVVEDTSSMAKVEDNFTANCRKNMRKGYKNIAHIGTLSKERFYHEHEKIYARQGLQCPFSYDLWIRLYEACMENNSGEIIAAYDDEENVLSLMFVVWDEKALYPLLGGAIPDYANLQTYTALTHKSISLAGEKHLSYDFEGSVIKRINHAFREYGATPKLYYRVRKIFAPQILQQETAKQLLALETEGKCGLVKMPKIGGGGGNT